MLPKPRRLLLVLAMACACNGSQDETSGFGTPSPTTLPPQTMGGSSTGSSGNSSTGDDSMSTSSTASTSTGPVLDMAVPDFGDPPPIGCKGKIDFIFSISASGTMQKIQGQLIDAFPAFMAAIEEQLPDFDVHILVANPNPKPGWIMSDCSLCMDDCDPLGEPPTCGAMLTQCDKQIGAGVTFPAGNGATNRRCELAGGNRYITSEPNDTEFACIAQVGLGGASRTAEAMVNALSPELNGLGGCDEDFLRDDALLVVTIINDGYDEDSAGTVNSWIEALRTAKHGDDDAFAVLVLTTDVDLGKYQLCLPDQAGPPNPLRQFALDVKHGFIDSICKDSYGPFFADTVAELVSLCDGFVIPQ